MLEPAPLVATPEASPPAGGEAEWFRGAGGARLRAALFTPPGQPRGSIILSGGRTEPIEKYYEVIGEFLERGFVVLAHDWRGQGLSARELPDRLKGHARGYKTFLDDFRLLLAAFESRLPKPWVAVGHSMGGCLTLLAMAHGERRFASAVLTAPMLGVNTGAVSRASARRAAWLFTTLFGRAGRYVQGKPGKPFDDDFEANILTHDPERFARTCGLLAAEPQLALGAPTWGWLDFAFRATAYLARPDRLREITTPVIIVQAEDDRLVDNAAQDAAARHLPQGKLIKVPGAYHEILMETDQMRNIFLRAFDALTGRTAPKPAAKPAVAPAAAPAAPTPAPQASAPAAAKPVEAPKPVVAPPAPAVAAAPAAAPAAKKPAARKPAAAKAAAKPAAVKAPAKAAAKPAPAKAPVAAKKPAAKAAKPAVAKPAAAKPAVAKVAAKPAAEKKPAAKAKAVAKPVVAKPVVAKKPPAKPAAAKAAPKTAAKAVAEKKPAAKAAAKPALKAAATAAPAPKTTAPKTTAPKAKVVAKKPAAKKLAPV